MASIVKANASLTAGGLAVLRRSYSTTDDGTLNYEADYCCLAPFASNHVGRFRTGAQPPTAIPASMLALRLDAPPKLYDLSTNTQNGLTYFNARYSAASVDPGEVVLTETNEQRSFSATVSGTVRLVIADVGSVSNAPITQTVESSVSVSFDYISTTVRVEAKNPSALPDVQGSVGLPFNRSIGQVSGVDPVVVGQWRATTIETTSKTKSSRGIYTYSKSSSGIYEVTNRIL